MRPTIFVRLVIGYLAVFVPVAALTVYAFSQLALFHRVAHDIYRVDGTMKDLGDKLSADLLAQTRYEKKYVITRDKELRNRFALIGDEVSKRIDEGIAIADTADKKNTLVRIRDRYRAYRAQFDQEAGYLEKGRPYSEKASKAKKEEAVDATLREIRSLRLLTEQDTRERIRRLGESGARANRMALAMGGGFILFGIVISLFITRSITRPLSRMKEKTRQVAGGDFGPPLELASPPEMKALAEDFNRMCVKLGETDKMKSDFFSLMAHELRMPLASIREGTSLLLKGIGEDQREKRREVLAIIAEESDHLIDLVNSLLDLAKMEAGMLTFDRQLAAIEPIIRKAVSSLEPLAMARNVDMRVEAGQDLPEIMVDRERIGQVLRNLIGNAVKFTPGGGSIIIEARLMEKEVRVSVADTGPGIPEEDLTAIFDKFQQARVTKYSKIKGTGMGLAIVRHIITAHGGKVWAESESGRGSTFIFLLPL